MISGRLNSLNTAAIALRTYVGVATNHDHVSTSALVAGTCMASAALLSGRYLMMSNGEISL